MVINKVNGIVNKIFTLNTSLSDPTDYGDKDDGND